MQPELPIAEAFGPGSVQGSLVLTAAGWGGYNTVSRLVTSSGHWAVKRHGWRVMPDSDSAFGVELDAYVGGVDGGGTLEGDDPIALRCTAAALAPWVVQNIRIALDRPSPQQDVLSGLLVDALIAPRTIAVRQALLTESLGRL